jgi:hypothetical protein
LRAAAFLTLTLLGLGGLASGCGGDGSASGGEDTTTAAATRSTHAARAPRTVTVLGARANDGPYVPALALKLDFNGKDPIPFYVCAAWDERRAPAGCKAAAGAKLPAGTIMRLEQKPAGPAVTYPDSPGWGTVGTSDSPELEIPLSNLATGNKVGKVTYRATVRNRESGAIVAASAPFVLTWQKP